MAGSYTYNPETGKWKHNSSDNSSSKKSSGSNSGGNKNSGGSSGNTKNNSNNSNKSSSGNKDNLKSTASSKKTSEGKVENKYNYIEVNTLSGTLNFIVNENTIKLKAGDTVKLEGIGKYLSGNYFVKDITRQISNNGYSHSATLIKTDFGPSLKTITQTPVEKKPVEEKPVVVEKPVVKKEESSPSKENAQRTYTVKKGDCLWNIAKKYYGSGSAYTKIYDANTKKIADPHWIYPGQVFVIP